MRLVPRAAVGVAVSHAGKTVQQRDGHRPADVLHFVPITTPWAPYPPQPGPMSASMLARGHVVGRDGKTCRACKAIKPLGGWLPCPKAP